jgi:hypothetical protein
MCGMINLKPLKFHDLSAGSTAGSDEQGKSFQAYLWDHTYTSHASPVAEYIGSHDRHRLIHRICCLRAVLPTVLLGAYGWMRYQQRAVRWRIQVGIGVAQRPLSSYEIRGVSR